MVLGKASTPHSRTTSVSRGAPRSWFGTITVGETKEQNKNNYIYYVYLPNNNILNYPRLRLLAIKNEQSNVFFRNLQNGWTDFDQTSQADSWCYKK